MGVQLNLKSKFIFHLLAIFAGLAILFSFAPAAYAVSGGGNGNQKDEEKADIQNATCTGADLKYTTKVNNKECSFDGLDASAKFNKIIQEVINFFSIIIGIIAVLMIIVGGFRYIISGGDSGNITTAKNTILYAIIGLIIVAFAQSIVKFILSKAVDIAS